MDGFPDHFSGGPVQERRVGRSDFQVAPLGVDDQDDVGHRGKNGAQLGFGLAHFLFRQLLLGDLPAHPPHPHQAAVFYLAGQVVDIGTLPSLVVQGLGFGPGQPVSANPEIPGRASGLSRVGETSRSSGQAGHLFSPVEPVLARVDLVALGQVGMLADPLQLRLDRQRHRDRFPGLKAVDALGAVGDERPVAGFAVAGGFAVLRLGQRDPHGVGQARHPARGFLDVVIQAGLHRFDGDLLAARAGEHDHRAAGPAGLGLAQDSHPIRPGKLVIGDHQVVTAPGHGLAQGDLVIDLVDFGIGEFGFQLARGKRADHRVVVDQQEAVCPPSRAAQGMGWSPGWPPRCSDPVE